MATEVVALNKPQSFPINWAASKERISRFVVACGAHEVVGAMIYDLGHYGRGYSEFGLNDKPVNLKFSKGKFLNSGLTLEAYSPSGLFLTQIVESIEKYEPERTAWEREIVFLREMIHALDTKIMIALAFSELDDQRRRNLTSITEISV